MNTHQPTTEVENPEDFQETVFQNQKCPQCKEDTLRQSEHFGICSEKCLNPSCDHRDTYSR